MIFMVNGITRFVRERDDFVRVNYARLLKDNIVDGIKNPELFWEYDTSPAKTILLYGPPGTGKTLLAEAVATEAGAKLILTGTETYSKWLGESEERIRSKFSKALENGTCSITCGKPPLFSLRYQLHNPHFHQQVQTISALNTRSRIYLAHTHRN